MRRNLPHFHPEMQLVHSLFLPVDNQESYPQDVIHRLYISTVVGELSTFFLAKKAELSTKLGITLPPLKRVKTPLEAITSILGTYPLGYRKRGPSRPLLGVFTILVHRPFFGTWHASCYACAGASRALFQWLDGRTGQQTAIGKTNRLAVFD